MRPDKMNRQLQKQVKNLQSELKQTQRAFKQTQKSMRSMHDTMADAMQPEAPQGGGDERTVGSVMKTLLFGSGLPDIEVDPNSIPRDHIMDPTKMKKEAVMANAGSGAAAIDESTFDVDLLFEAELQNKERGKATQRPPFIADACFDVVDHSGLERWEKTYKDTQKKIKQQHAYKLEHPEPISTIAIQGKESSFLLKTLKEHKNCYGAIGFSPDKYEVSLEQVDQTLTEALNQTENIVAIGPVGIDDQRLPPDSIEKQKQLLTLQLDIAVDFAIPVIIRHRDAAILTQDVLNTFPRKEELFVLWSHPIRSEDEYNWLKDNDFYVSLTPEITTPKAAETLKFIQEFPQNRLLLMSGDMVTPPQQRMGQWNTPWLLEETFNFVAADVFKLTEENDKNKLLHRLNTNFIHAFFGGEEDDTSTESEEKGA